MFEVIDARGANPKHGKRASTLKRALLVSTALIGFQVTPLVAQDVAFDGFYGQNWSNNGNWYEPNTLDSRPHVNAAGTTAIFDFSFIDANPVLVDGNFTLGGMVIRPRGNDIWTFDSAGLGELIFDNNGSAATIDNSASGSQTTTFTSNVLLRLSDDLNVSSTGSLNIASDISSLNGGAAVNLDFDAASGSTITVSGNISQPDGNITVSTSGAGQVTLSGANTFSDIDVNAGTLTLSTATAFAGSGNINVGNGTLDAGGHTFTTNSFIGQNAVFTNGTISSSNTFQLQNATINGVLAGTGGLRALGNGTVVLLNGANTYSGTTTVSGGTLRIGASEQISNSSDLVMDGGTLDLNGFAETVRGFSGSGAVTTGGNGGKLTVNVTGNSTYSGTFAGANVTDQIYFQKNGGGTLTVSGENTTTGAGRFFVNGGTVEFSGGNAVGDRNILAVQAGTTVRLLSNETVGVVQANAGANVELGANTLTLRGLGAAFSSYFDGVISGTGDVVYDTINFSTNISRAQTYSGSTTIQSGTFQLSASGALTSTDVTVEGGRLRNQSGGLAAGTTLDVSGTGRVSIETNPDSITSLAMSGGTLDGDAALTITSASASALLLTGGTISTDLIVTGGVTINSGTNTLSGTNTITGGITVAGGTLRLGSSGAAGGAAGSITTTGSVIDYADGVNSATPINVNSNTTQLQVTTGSATQSGVISETGGPRPIEKIGNGTLTLSGANTYTGTTTVSAGTLTLAGGSAIADTGLVTVASGAELTLDASETIGSLSGSGGVTIGANTLTLAGSDTQTFSGTMTGAGGLVRRGSGTTNVTSSLTYSGTTEVTDTSTLNLTGNGAVGSTLIQVQGSSTLMSDGGAFLSSAAILVTGSGTVRLTGDETLRGIATVAGTTLNLDGGTVTMTLNPQLSGQVIGTGGITVSGTGNVTLSGTNTYTGTTTINSGGTLNVDNGAAIADTGAVIADGTLNLQASETIGSLAGSGAVTLGANTLTTGGANTSTTFSGVISGGSGFTKTGTGTQTLTGVNTYTGATSIDGGTLSLTGSGTLSGSSFITVDGGALVTDGGALNATSIVTLLDGTVTFSGNETVGTLGALAGANVILDGATVTYSASGVSTSQGATISGTGGLEMNATTSEVTLSGTNSYTGATTATVGAINITGSIASTVVGIGTSGTMDVAAGGFTGTPNVTNAGSLEIGTNTIASLSGAGTTTLDGGAILTVDGGTSNFSGTISGGASVLVSGGSTVFNNNSSGSVQTALTVDGATFNNNTGAEVTAAVTVQDGGTVVANGGSFGSTVDTEADTGSGVGTFEVAADTTVAGTFNNRGRVTTSGGTAVELTIGGGNAFNYLGGEIDATAADLTITAADIVVSGVTTTSGSVTYNGNLQLLEGASLDLTTDLLGNLDIDAGASINIAASISANGFDVTIDPELAGPPPVVAGNLSVGNGNAFTGVGTLTNNGTLTVGVGASITADTFNLNGATTLQQNAQLIGTGNTMNIAGPMGLADGADLIDAGAINVNVGGTVTIAGSSTLNADSDNDFGVGEALNIAGVVTTTDGGSNTITIGDGNTDVLNVNATGQLNIGNTDTVTGDDLVVNSVAGGLIALGTDATLNGDTLNLGGTTTLADGASLTAENAINITGTTTLNGGATLNADTDNNAAGAGDTANAINITGTLETTGVTSDTITIGDGDTDLILNTGIFNIATGDTVTGGDLSLANTGGGSVDLDGILTLTEADFDSFTNDGAGTTFTNDGELNIVNGTNSGTATFTNNGDFNGTALTNSATLTNSGTGTIALAVTNAAGGDFDNTGSITGSVISDGGDFDSTAGTIAALTHNSGTSDVTAGAITDLTVAGNGMTVGAGVTIGTLTQTGGTFAQVATVNGTTSLNGGVLTNTGTMTGQTTVTTGTFNQNNIAGAVTNNGGLVSITNTTGAVIHNGSAVNTTTISAGNTASLQVDADGAFVTAGGTVTGTTLINAGGVLTNTGTLTGQATLTGGALNQNGTAGDILNDGGTLAVAGNSGTVQHDSGTTAINSGTITALTVNANGASTVGGTIGTLSVTAGAFAHGGTVTGTSTLGGGTTTNTGTLGATVVSGGALASTGLVGGLNIISGSASITGGTVGNVLNAGTYTQSGATSGSIGNTGTASVEGVVNGTIANASGGDFTITGMIAGLDGIGHSGTGTFTVAAGNTTLDPGGIVNSSGNFDINGGLLGATLFANTGSGDLLVASGATLDAGLTTGASTQTTINGTVTGNITNSGSFTLTGTAGGTLANAAGGTAAVNGTVTGDVANAGTMTLAGTLGGNLATGTSTTTTVTGATTVAGDITVAGTFFANADLTFSNFTNNAAFPGAPYSVSASPMVISSGVTLTGNFTNNTRVGMAGGSTVNGNFANNGILVADGTATITGNLTSGAGTVVDVNDGATGDVVAIGGNAALNGRILMDVDLTGATDTGDRITVGGTVSGSPTFVFSNTGTELAQISDIDIVTYGAGSTMTPTTEGLPVNGAVLYSFIDNTSGNAWQLQSGVNPAIGGLSSGLALTQSLLGSVVNRPTSPFVSGLAVDDGKPCGVGGWGRATGGIARATGSTTTNLGSFDSEIRARYAGFQAGFDHSCFNGYYNGFDLSFGATVGYNFGSSVQPVYQFDPTTGLIDPTVLTSTNETDFSQYYGGAYVGFAKGPVFGDLQYRVARTEFDLRNVVAAGGAPLGVEDQTYTSVGHTVSGSLSYAKQIEAVPGLTVVPTAGFSFTNLTTSDITFINDPTDPTDDGLLQIDPQNSRIGFLSVALAKTHILPDGASALNVFGTGTVYHDFAAPSTSRYYQSVDAQGRPLGTPLTSTSSNLGTFGELSLGMNYTKIFDSGAGAPRQFDASIRVDGRFSNTIQGVGIVGQVRFQF